MMLINGLPADTVSAADRGLAYGDGVFRTIELVSGRPRLWRWHYARLRDDCRRLRLLCPDESLLFGELAVCSANLERAVAKVVITRGVGKRGYAMPGDAMPTRIVSAAAWGGYPGTLAEHGVTVRVCELRLSRQPLLAGIKHLNRLENVLARSEWDDPAIFEGLLLDEDGRVIEGTMSNLFYVRDGVLCTPKLDFCGVSGALRAWLMAAASEAGCPVSETRPELTELLDADELFLGNSLLGVVPVAELAQRRWSAFPVTRHWQQRLLDEN
ncbi:aminodeoxychorismate lyase [Crenobacter sp. SG2305]|uniref:aminodeoxychorismate lyase n=1 Tax=Crenobacter oryzisoli TaxID=3056844 RepID=UPI0025AAAF14|nr:aminodeoxychorismate lyase [Crenobacter sp. SG2305]MDN0081407.1 aminodeoxychorismate lyase [Crenobacter sp. SG2305]